MGDEAHIAALSGTPCDDITGRPSSAQLLDGGDRIPRGGGRFVATRKGEKSIARKMA